MPGRARRPGLARPRDTTSAAPAKPSTSPATLPVPKRSRRNSAASTADQMGISPTIQPACTAVVSRMPKAWSSWWKPTPTKPISASGPHESRGGTSGRRRAASVASSSAVPSAEREKMSVTGEISRSAALVATNEIPQRTTARKACRRGGMDQARGAEGGASRPRQPEPADHALGDEQQQRQRRRTSDHSSRPKRASRTRRARSAPGWTTCARPAGNARSSAASGIGGEVRLARVRVHGERAAHGRALDHAVEPGPLERRRDQARRARRGHQLGRHLAAPLVLDAPQAGRRGRAGSARPASATRPPCRGPAP